MLSCKDATGLVSESMDHRLPLRRRMALRFHLMMCRYCSRFERQLHFLRTAARRHNEQADGMPGPSLSAEARGRLRDVINETADE